MYKLYNVHHVVAPKKNSVWLLPAPSPPPLALSPSGTRKKWLERKKMVSQSFLSFSFIYHSSLSWFSPVKQRKTQLTASFSSSSSMSLWPHRSSRTHAECNKKKILPLSFVSLIQHIHMHTHIHTQKPQTLPLAHAPSQTIKNIFLFSCFSLSLRLVLLGPCTFPSITSALLHPAFSTLLTTSTRLLPQAPRSDKRPLSLLIFSLLQSSSFLFLLPFLLRFLYWQASLSSWGLNLFYMLCVYFSLSCFFLESTVIHPGFLKMPLPSLSPSLLLLLPPLLSHLWCECGCTAIIMSYRVFSLPRPSSFLLLLPFLLLFLHR